MASIRTDSGVTSITGKLTVVEAGNLKDRLLSLLETDGDILLDLSEVEDIDSAGFQLLALLNREAMATGGRRVRITEHSQASQEIIRLFRAYDLSQ